MHFFLVQFIHSFDDYKNNKNMRNICVCYTAKKKKKKKKIKKSDE